jgi:hypothetical protein
MKLPHGPQMNAKVVKVPVWKLPWGMIVVLLYIFKIWR